MLQEKENMKRLLEFKRLFQRVGNRTAFSSAQRLILQARSQDAKEETAYDWWTQILQTMNSKTELKDTILQVLSLLAKELHANACSLHFANYDGIFEIVTFPESDSSYVAELAGRVLTRIFQKRHSLL